MREGVRGEGERLREGEGEFERGGERTSGHISR